VETSELKHTNFTLPIDLGQAFARKHTKLALGLGLLAFPLAAIAQILSYSYRLGKGDELLLGIVSSLPQVWIATVAVLLAITSLSDATTPFREKGMIRYRTICRSAFIYMPKVVLSFFVARAVVELGIWMLVLPGIFMFCLLLWAPAFCIGEIFFSQTEQGKKEENEASSDGIEEEQHYFKRLSIFALGFSRSAQLSGLNLPAAFQLFILLTAALIVPWAFFNALGGPQFELFASLGHLLVSGLLLSYLSFLWAGTFCVLLSRDAASELSLSATALQALDERTTNTFKSRPGVLFGLLMLNVLCSYYGVRELQRRAMLPEHANVRIAEKRLTERDFTLTLELTDYETRFRWLNPRGFMLKLIEEEPGAEELDPVTTKEAETEIAVPKSFVSRENRLIEPSRAFIQDDPGEVVTSGIGAEEASMKAVLTYSRLPEDVRDKRFTLLYVPPFSAAQPVLESSFGASRW